MSNLPIIRIELDGVRNTVAAMLTDKNKEISEYVIKSLEKQITEDWVIEEIDTAVKSCLKSAIASVANDYQMRSAITELISNAVTHKLTGCES